MAQHIGQALVAIPNHLYMGQAGAAAEVRSDTILCEHTAMQAPGEQIFSSNASRHALVTL